MPSKRHLNFSPATPGDFREEPSFAYFCALAESKLIICKREQSIRKQAGILSEPLGNTGTKIQIHFLVISVPGMEWQQHQPGEFSVCFRKWLQEERSKG